MSTLDSHLQQPREPSGALATTSLIGQAYEAATEPDRWPGWFESLAGRLAHRASNLVFRGFGPTRYVDLETPEAGLTTLNPARVFETKSLSRQSFAIALVGDEIVEDWRRIHARDSSVGSIEVYSASSLRSPDRSLLRDVLPHLHRALGIHFRLHQASQAQGSLSACLDALSIATMVLDRRGAVLFANRTAHDFLDLDAGLAQEHGILRPSCPRDDLVFRANLKDVTSGRPRTLRGQTLEGGLTLWLFALGPDRAAACITARRQERPVAPELLTDAFGLTPAEARVGSLFAKGQNLRAIAGQLGISEHTVRVHLKKIQHKTGTRRQATLLLRVLETVPPIRSAE